MRPGLTTMTWAALAAPGLFLVAMGDTSGRGDEPGRLGRFFRFGPAPSPPADAAPRSHPETEAAPESRLTPFPARPSPPPPPDAPTATRAAAPPRLIPQPRVSRPVTDADPIVTRISVGRSDDGTQFGMFLQVYADGTVIDSEGVHQPGREAIREVVNALAQGDLSRVKGHCGGPSTDFVELVQMVVYERSLGRLRANAFSFSGNPQTCDQSVRRLQTTLDALQAALSRPANRSAPTAAPATGLPDLTPTTAPVRENRVSIPLEH